MEQKRQLAFRVESVSNNDYSYNNKNITKNIRPNRFRSLVAGALVSAGIALLPINARAGPNRPAAMPPATAQSEGQRQQAYDALRVPQAPKMEYEGGLFWLENAPEGPTLVYEKEGLVRSVALNLPPASLLGEAFAVHYGEKFSAVLTRNQGTGENFAVITLGAAAVAAGMQTLPGNDLLNADCVLLPEPPVSHSLAEDRLFLFYENGVVRVLDETGRLRVLRFGSVTSNAVAVKFRGLYIMLQPGATPLVFARIRESSAEAQAFDHDGPGLRQLIGHSAGPSGLCVRFLNSEGQQVELKVTVGEEGNLDTVDVELR